MKKHLEAYAEKLKKAICEYAEMSVSERTAHAVGEMLESLDAVENRIKENAPRLSCEELKEWVAGMHNDDGTKGAHWECAQTSAVADEIGVDFSHVTKWEWWAALNMIYSDYSKVAEKFGTETAEFFGEIAKAFLFDEDGPGPAEKLSAYYRAIVAPSKAM